MKCLIVSDRLSEITWTAGEINSVQLSSAINDRGCRCEYQGVVVAMSLLGFMWILWYVFLLMVLSTYETRNHWYSDSTSFVLVSSSHTYVSWVPAGNLLILLGEQRVHPTVTGFSEISLVDKVFNVVFHLKLTWHLHLLVPALGRSVPTGT